MRSHRTASRMLEDQGDERKEQRPKGREKCRRREMGRGREMGRRRRTNLDPEVGAVDCDFLVGDHTPVRVLLLLRPSSPRPRPPPPPPSSHPPARKRPSDLSRAQVCDELEYPSKRGGRRAGGRRMSESERRG
eukprot:764282-Hanusia_phi.AAC.1